MQKMIFHSVSFEIRAYEIWTVICICFPGIALYLASIKNFSHFRLDYPEMDTKNWNAWINIYKGSDGSMKLEKQPFDSWPT